MDIERMCTFINDSTRLSEEIGTLLDSVSMVDESECELKMVLLEASDNLEGLFVQLANFTSAYLAKSINEDVQSVVFDHIFTPEWENNEEDHIGILVKTLRQYFEDLIMWLPEYSFSKVVSECFEISLKNYMVGAMGGNKAVKSFKTHFAEVGRHLVNDFVKLKELFVQDYAEQLQMSRALREEGAIEKRLGVLIILSDILKASTAASVESQILNLLKEFGGNENAILWLCKCKGLMKSGMSTPGHGHNRDNFEVGSSLSEWKATTSRIIAEEERRRGGGSSGGGGAKKNIWGIGGGSGGNGGTPRYVCQYNHHAFTVFKNAAGAVASRKGGGAAIDVTNAGSSGEENGNGSGSENNIGSSSTPGTPKRWKIGGRS
jgi:hypothetical protein